MSDHMTLSPFAFERCLAPDTGRSVPLSRRPAAVLFDLDGVLWNSNRTHAAAFDLTCAANGIPPVSYELIAGMPTEAAWDVILQRAGRTVSPDVRAELCRQKRERARAELRARPPLVDGGHTAAILPMLGMAVALVTGSSSQTVDVFLEAFPAAGVFSSLVTADDGLPGKPAPDGFRRAADQLGVPTADCWVLEDSVAGLTAAVAAGTNVVHLGGSDCALDHPSGVWACVTGVRHFVRLLVESGGAA